MNRQRKLRAAGRRGTAFCGYNELVRLLLLLFAALCLSGCGLFGGEGLEQTALRYYRYRLGQSPGTTLSSFFSPVHKALIKPEDLATMDRRLSGGRSANSRFAEVRLEDIAASVDEAFALTMFKGQESSGLAQNEYVRWVRAGRRWCLYMGSGAEVEAYGLFPESLPPPRLDADGPQPEDGGD